MHHMQSRLPHSTFWRHVPIQARTISASAHLDNMRGPQGCMRWHDVRGALGMSSTASLDVRVDTSWFQRGQASMQGWCTVTRMRCALCMCLLCDLHQELAQPYGLGRHVLHPRLIHISHVPLQTARCSRLAL